MDISVVMPFNNESMTVAIEFVRSKGISCEVVDIAAAIGDYICPANAQLEYSKQFLHQQFVFMWYLTGGHYTHFIYKYIDQEDDLIDNSECYFHKRVFSERKDFIEDQAVLMGSKIAILAGQVVGIKPMTRTLAIRTKTTIPTIAKAISSKGI
ncbi:hypothetical protein BASA81_008127 [Batrachochytrium salamandrivorans]|nr:hypothetical protein BASA81_008127 [Batrachochytrium salamandrivorans]